jgi:hypothetical protein
VFGQFDVLMLYNLIEPGCRVGVHALAQRGARWNICQPQSANKKGVGAKVLYRIKVVLAQAQQGKVGLEDVAVGNARANWKGRINQRVDFDELGPPVRFVRKPATSAFYQNWWLGNEGGWLW